MPTGSNSRPRNFGAARQRKGAIRAVGRQSWIASVLVCALITASCGGASPSSSQSQNQKPPVSTPPTAQGVKPPSKGSETGSTPPKAAASAQTTTTGTASSAAAQTGGAPPTGAALTASSAGGNSVAADQLRQVLRAVAKFDSAIPADTYDPQAVVTQVGRDPNALFQWVRDSTVWVPYMGVLRGPVGVMMDRTGNDLDRALLLCELLRRAGKQVRLARGQLSDPQVSALLRSIHRPPSRLRSSGTNQSPELSALLGQFAGDAAPYSREIARLLDGLVQQDRQMLKQALDRSQQQVQTLANALGFSAPAPAIETDFSLVRDHWWVQWLNGSTWTDLDPSLAQNNPGDRNADTRETVDPSGIDPALYHTVQIAVVVERWDQGHLAESNVLSKAVRTSDLFGVDISLLHLPIMWPGSMAQVSGANFVSQGTAIGLNQHEWLPVLRVGTDVHSEFSFSDDGVQRNGRPGVGTTMTRGLDQVTSAFGGGDASAHSILTAEWIRYSVKSPGEPAATIQRPVFDLIGPAQRAMKTVPEPAMTDQVRRDLAGVLMGRTDILVLGAQLSRGFVSHLFAKRLLGDGQPLLDALSAAAESVEAVQKMSGKIIPLPGPLYDLALARSAWSRVRSEVYVARPQILSAHVVASVGPGGELRGTYSFDIVSNEVAVRPNTNANASALRLAQGIADTTGEAILTTAIGDTSQEQRPITNASDMLAQRSGGVNWLTIRSTTDPSWQRLQIDADARARLTEDIAAGYVVVAPDHVPTVNGRALFCWWRVDPKTGSSLGLGPQGWGQSMAEYALLLIDTCLCASEFGPGAKKGSFASALGLVTCLALGGAAFMSWAVKGVEYGREMGVGFALTQAIFVALVKVFDFFEPDGAKE